MLGVELYRLWRVGRRELPALGRWYGGVARRLRGVSHDSAGWDGLRLELLSVYARAERQAHEAAERVCAAADGYAAADRAAGDALRGIVLAREGLPSAAERR